MMEIWIYDQEILQSEYDEVYSFVNEECKMKRMLSKVKMQKKHPFHILSSLNNILTSLPLMKD